MPHLRDLVVGAAEKGHGDVVARRLSEASSSRKQEGTASACLYHVIVEAEVTPCPARPARVVADVMVIATLPEQGLMWPGDGRRATIEIASFTRDLLNVLDDAHRVALEVSVN